MLHILDLHGNYIKSFAVHSASVADICMDVTGDIVATASIDGEHSLFRMLHSLSNLRSWCIVLLEAVTLTYEHTARDSF